MCFIMSEYIGKYISLPCVDTLKQFGSIFQTFVLICSLFLVSLLSFILWSKQIYFSVCFLNFILVVVILFVHFTRATIRRNIRLS
jgi:hypothetical protein